MGKHLVVNNFLHLGNFENSLDHSRPDSGRHLVVNNFLHLYDLENSLDYSRPDSGQHHVNDFLN